jgi:tetratricopeptide (TPR) repeat protein
MIITERFVFIHMHKTGGQTLSDVITDCIADHRVIGYHYPRSLIPQEFAGLPVIGFVRNPWSWYVSWYSFNRQPNIRNSLFHVVSDGGQADFATTVSNLVNLGSGDEPSRQQREQLIDILPATLDGNRGVGLTKQDIRDLGESGSGYYTWLFDRMVGLDEDPDTFVGRFENLQQDFLDIMRQLEVPETDAIAWAMNYGRRKNTSRHSHYSHYYADPVRDLVAGREQPLLDRFGYRFEAVGPRPGPADTVPEDAIGETQKFQKLMGRADNYLQVNAGFDIEPLRQRVGQITEAEWSASDRDEHFHVHRDTRSVTLIEFIAHKDEEPRALPLYSEFEELVQPVVDHIADYYQDNGFVIRVLLAKLLAGCNIKEHVDTGYSLLAVHRVHIPVITNNDTVFSVGGEQIRMRAGEFWEIDNSKAHAVTNSGDEDRVHMIVDWMPNHAGLSCKAAIDRVRPAAAARPDKGTPALDQMIAQAYEYQREGKLHKAEARYRYVLDIDPDHPVCNNLMGMLCRQMRRYDDAVRYIQAAIKAAPNEAKSHANLGQAFLMLGQFAESAKSFQSALSLNPGLDSARVGLQRARNELDNVENSRSAR